MNLKNSMLFLLALILSSLPQWGHACGFTSQVPVNQEFVVPDSTADGYTAFNVYATSDVFSVNPLNDPNNPYFVVEKFGQAIIFKATSDMEHYYQDRDDPHISIYNVTLKCSGGVEFVQPEIKIFITDVNNHNPVFRPAAKKYKFDLPYSGAPVNWEEFIEVTDRDFFDNNTALVFDTNRPDLIDLTHYPIQRVPEDSGLQLQYYVLYFGVNRTWDQVGLRTFTIQATDPGGRTNNFVGTLDIGKKCKILTDLTQPFTIPEDAIPGQPVITLDVDHVLSINETWDPVNDKYFEFEFDAPNQQIRINPKPTLATYFDQEETDQWSILSLHLTCTGISHTEPEIKILIKDLNNKAPRFEPAVETYFPELPYNGEPINVKQFIRVMDPDFTEVNTALTFKHDRPDLIYFDPGYPERVPQDITKRLEYYKLYFTLVETWDTAGIQTALIEAEDGAGNTAAFTLILDISKCLFSTDLTQTFLISEDAGVGETVLTLDVEGVTSVNSSGDPVNDKYFLYDLDVTNQKLHVKAKTSLSTFFDQESSPSLTIREIGLTCDRAFHTEPIIQFHVEDVNDKIPQFDPPEASYLVELPYFGAPINWQQFIRVTDADYLEVNTVLHFSVSSEDLIVLPTTHPIERVPSDLDQRLDYYKLYFELNETWTTVGVENASLRAMDGAGNFKDFFLTLNIVEGPPAE